MKVTDVQFNKSVFNLKDLPEPHLPEIAFSGRSNVGKSSLINTLLNRRGIARTSSTPGRTQSINFIEVNKALFFIDLPGYGYAKIPIAVRSGWQQLIEGYLQGRASLRLLCLIIDARREPSEDEGLFCRWLKIREIPCMVTLTKIDKINRGQLGRSVETWQSFLRNDDICRFSAVTGQGKDIIWKRIMSSLKKQEVRQ